MNQSLYAQRTAHFARPFTDHAWEDKVSDAFARANEMMALYVLRLVQESDQSLAGDHWFRIWGEAYRETYEPVFKDLMDFDRDRVRSALLELEPTADRVLDLFDFVSVHLNELLLKGRVAEELFFAPGQLVLWDRYFNTQNALYQINNDLAVNAARNLIKPGDKICEIGGGLGSAARSLAAGLSRQQAESIHLTFTDAVPIFLQRARRTLIDLPFNLEFKRYDINQTPSFESGTFDLIYGVNVVHVALDMESTLGHLRNCLKPNGTLLLIECTRPQLELPIYPEYVFGFFRDFHHRLITESRPKGGFLDGEHWRKCLLQAGFNRVQIVPEQASYGNYPFIFSSRLMASSYQGMTRPS